MGRERCVLAGILFLAALIRLVDLDSTPPGPSPDEVSNAVDARCLGETGCDRHGQFLPLYLRAYGDYREALFTYMAVPLQYVLGPLMALRLLSATLGLATVALAYVLGRRLFDARVGLWSSFFVATNPQHVLWSRIGMEQVLMPALGALVWLAFLACERRSRRGPVAASLGLVLVIYGGPMGKPLAVILALVLLVHPAFWWGELRDRPALMGLAVFLLALGTAPAWHAIASGTGGAARFRMIGLQGGSTADLARRFLVQYATYWSPAYLIFPHGGGAPDLPWAGKMGYVEFGCLWVGIVALLVARPRYARALLLFLVLYAVPAALTNSVASGRVLIGVPILQVVAGYGAARARDRRVVALLIVGGLGTFALTAFDLRTTTNPHLDVFFSGPSRRAVAAASARARDRRLVVLDMDIPYGVMYWIYHARPRFDTFQGGMEPHRLLTRPIGKARVAFAPEFARTYPAGRFLFVTRKGERIPGASVVYEDGDYWVQDRG